MDDYTAKRIAEIKTRTDAATAGPWEKYGNNGVMEASEKHACVALTYDGNKREDAEFIAAARDDIPWMLDQLNDSLQRERQMVDRIDTARAKSRDDNTRADYAESRLADEREYVAELKADRESLRAVNGSLVVELRSERDDARARVGELEREIHQLKAQLAACAIAAHGNMTSCKDGDYAWSSALAEIVKVVAQAEHNKAQLVLRLDGAEARAKRLHEARDAAAAALEEVLR